VNRLRKMWSAAYAALAAAVPATAVTRGSAGLAVKRGAAGAVRTRHMEARDAR